MSDRTQAQSLRWVSWAAVSSLPQAEKVSLEVQRADNLAAVTKHGGQLVAVLDVPGHTRYYIELDEAAAVPELAAYATLRELIRAGAFDVLVFRAISRLGRTAALCMTVVGLCQRAGIITYETANPPPTLALRGGHSDMLINAIQSVGAQHEIHRLQERHKMGMLGRVKAGNQAGRAVYGYVLRFDDQGKRRMVVDEAAAAVVRQILDMYANGTGGHTIMAWLNENGLPSYSGVPWIPRMVYNILDRVWRYAGFTELNRTGDAVYRLSGVCVCAVCGGGGGISATAPTSITSRCAPSHSANALRISLSMASPCWRRPTWRRPTCGCGRTCASIWPGDA